VGYLSIFDTIYLIGVLAAFGVFAVSLLTVSIATNLAERKAAVAVRPAPPEASASNVRRLSAGRDHAA
jgi:hypothetical protein